MAPSTSRHVLHTGSKGRIVSPSASLWGSVTFPECIPTDFPSDPPGWDVVIYTGNRSGTVTVAWDQSRIGNLAENDHLNSVRGLMPWKTWSGGGIWNSVRHRYCLWVLGLPTGEVNILVDFQEEERYFLQYFHWAWCWISEILYSLTHLFT